MNRREFIQATGYGALGMAMTSKLSPIARATAVPPATFDINQAFASFMSDLGDP